MALTRDDLPLLMAQIADRFAAERDALIALDGKVGDSDLGLTMAKGFAAARDMVADQAAAGADIATQLKQAGAAINKAAPSTMGTLMATGFLRGGKALDGAEVMDTDGLAAFWTAFAEGVAQRGKARPGDKTVLDVLQPIADTLSAQAAAGADEATALHAATQAGAQALEATKDMVAQHGKAAAFQEKTRGLQDAGGTVAAILIAEFSLFADRNGQGGRDAV